MKKYIQNIEKPYLTIGDDLLEVEIVNPDDEVVFVDEFKIENSECPNETPIEFRNIMVRVPKFNGICIETLKSTAKSAINKFEDRYILELLCKSAKSNRQLFICGEFVSEHLDWGRRVLNADAYGVASVVCNPAYQDVVFPWTASHARSSEYRRDVSWIYGYATTMLPYLCECKDEDVWWDGYRSIILMLGAKERVGKLLLKDEEPVMTETDDGNLEFSKRIAVLIYPDAPIVKIDISM